MWLRVRWLGVRCDGNNIRQSRYCGKSSNTLKQREELNA